MDLGGPEVLVILFVVLLLFGGKKLPELFKALGQGVREFRDGMSGIGEDDEESHDKSSSTS